MSVLFLPPVWNYCNFTLFSSLKRDFFFCSIFFLSKRTNIYKIYNIKYILSENCLVVEMRGIRMVTTSFILQGAKILARK